jgi:hypothetical protein
MHQDELFDKIEKVGLIPVPIEIAESSDDQGRFVGDLDHFLATSKAIGATAIFVENFLLQDWHFHYNPYEDEAEDDEAGDPKNEIDLTTISPNLKKYKKYLGQNLWFELRAKGGAGDLSLAVDQDWKQAFDDEIEHAEGEAVLSRPPLG